MAEVSAFSFAEEYLRIGRCVIPSGGGGQHKQALIRWVRYQTSRPTLEQLEDWQRKFAPSIWAMPTGGVSGCFVIDCDEPKAVAIMEAVGVQPHVKTSKGAHYYCRWPDWIVPSSARILPGMDIRGQGGYVNFCGTNGAAKYETLILPTDESLYRFDQLPVELQRLLQPAPANGKQRTTANKRILEGERNTRLTSLGGSMRRHGTPESAIEDALLRTNTTLCEPPLSDAEVREIARSVARYEPKAEPQPSRYKLTDLGNAERLVSQHGDKVRYCYKREKWLVWNGKVWDWDLGDKLKALAKSTVRSIYQEAANEPDEAYRKEIAAHAKRSESEQKIKAMIALAESEPGITVELNNLNTNRWLFNCGNGTINLQTGQLQPHRKEDLLTILVPINYQNDAQCPLWDKFLDRVTCGSGGLKKYLQVAVGYSLTGTTRLQILFFLYGLGSNGKSTFLSTIRMLTGEYGGRVSTDAFMLKDKYLGGARESLANLLGKRFVVASELEEGRRFAVGLIKDMTGGESITADRKYEHEFEFQPTHKLWLAGNHKPSINDTTLSIWRRVKLIPFNVIIPPGEVDPELPGKLAVELPGILTWAVQGCLEWQKNGLSEPEVITNATNIYRDEQDLLGDFIEDFCILDPRATIPKADLKDRYQKWCEVNKSEPLSQKQFKAKLTERGVVDEKKGSTRYWKGITQKSPVPDSALNGTNEAGNSIKSDMRDMQEEFTENPVQFCPGVPEIDNSTGDELSEPIEQRSAKPPADKKTTLEELDELLS